METRLCKNCKQVKAVSEFNRQGPGKGQFQSRCKPCQAEYAKAWRAAKNSEKSATHKLCSTCMQMLPREAFSLMKDRRRHTWYPIANCKPCESARKSKGGGIIRSESIAPPPCDDCKMADYCRKTTFTCRAFNEYTKFGKWSSEYPKLEVA